MREYKNLLSQPLAVDGMSVPAKGKFSVGDFISAEISRLEKLGYIVFLPGEKVPVKKIVEKPVEHMVDVSCAKDSNDITDNTSEKLTFDAEMLKSDSNENVINKKHKKRNRHNS